MKFINKPIILSAFAAIILSSCGGSGAPILTTPIENIDNTPIKEASLTDAEEKNWGHLDLVKDTIPGMSVDKAYAEIIKGKRGQTVIVAVIDSGIDIEHEDLDGVLWTNTKEIPNNGKDDDKNGYVDDIHGWNFLGDGYDEQLEFVRILASGNTNAPRYAEVKAEYDKMYAETVATKQNIDGLLQQIEPAQEAIRKHLNKKDYTAKDVAAIKTEDEALSQAISIQKFLYSRDLTLEDVKKYATAYAERLNYNLNKDLKGRKTGDNPDDFNDKPGYGNGNVMPVKKSESHGTHVAGIIAAERNNGLGANGVANNVKIMSIRTVPNGDEYDKDVAKAIRYAVDNGAKVINGSFGKSFSPHAEWVRDAIKYASDNDVIFVHAAGNDSKDVDTNPNFPDDNNGGPEVSNTYIRVGSLTNKYGTNMISSFSNYGKKNVDVFAPGSDIYSTVPENEYEPNSGTSMAAPGVAGVAALIRSQFPKLTAAQVKQIILDSGLPVPAKVVVGGNANDVRTLGDISKSGKIVNAYNALVMAKQLSK
ncbi:S8 family peptidase [Lacinutrix salivirga]